MIVFINLFESMFQKYCKYFTYTFGDQKIYLYKL